MKQTNKSAVGASFYGHTINATVKQLRSILGKPVFSDNDGKDKVNFEWNMETSAGDVFSVYDWKEYRRIEETEVINWHIGGKSPSVTELAQSEIENALKAPSTHSTLPETGKTVTTKDGEVLPMNDEETEVMYKGEWCSIQDDQDGGFYFLSHGEFGGIVFYIEMPESEAPPTPGNEREGEGWQAQHDTVNDYIFTRDKNGKRVPIACTYSGEVGREKAKENSLLIAAAPDMLKLLKDFCLWTKVKDGKAEWKGSEIQLNEIKAFLNSITGGK